MFSALPKTTEAQVLGKQLLRSGTSIGANYREAFRARSKADFIAKCGDSLREIEEWSVLGNRDIDGEPARERVSCWESSESKRLLAGTARGIGGCQRGKARTFATRVRRADRDFRYHPEASEDFLMESPAVATHPLRLPSPSSFPTLSTWFTSEYQKSGKKLDMGKGCVRFKSLEGPALNVVGKTVARVSVEEHIANYRAARAKLKKKSA